MSQRPYREQNAGPCAPEKKRRDPAGEQRPAGVATSAATGRRAKTVACSPALAWAAAAALALQTAEAFADGFGMEWAPANPPPHWADEPQRAAEEPTDIYITPDRRERLEEVWTEQEDRFDRYSKSGGTVGVALSGGACAAGTALIGQLGPLAAGAAGAACAVAIPKAEELGRSMGGDIAELRNRRETEELGRRFSVPPAPHLGPAMIPGSPDRALPPGAYGGRF